MHEWKGGFLESAMQALRDFVNKTKNARAPKDYRTKGWILSRRMGSRPRSEVERLPADFLKHYLNGPGMC